MINIRLVNFTHCCFNSFPLSIQHRGLWVMCPQVDSVVLVLDELGLKRRYGAAQVAS